MDINVYEARARGKKICETQGSSHYKGKVEPMELIMAIDYVEGFCIGNIIKYAARFKRTRNLKDLAKIADNAHILAGALSEQDGAENGRKPEATRSKARSRRRNRVRLYYPVI